MKVKTPKGVKNAVKGADSGESGICQKPKFASNFVKKLAPLNCAKICSTAG